MAKKEYQIIYKFSDVIDNVKANDEKEAEKIAQDRLDGDEETDPKKETYCYNFEVEEVE